MFFNFIALALGIVRLNTSEEKERKINNVSIVISFIYPLCRGRKTASTEIVDLLSVLVKFILSHKFETAVI
jgi:hypothetical protein